jgi:DNA modification methylase
MGRIGLMRQMGQKFERCEMSNDNIKGPVVQGFRLSELRLSGWNPRVMTDDARAALEKSMLKFGCVEPIIVNMPDKVVIAGEQRYRILRKENSSSYNIQCVVVELSVADAKLLNLSLHNPALHGRWIDDLDGYIDQLKSELVDLDDYYALEIDKLRTQISAAASEDADDAPPLPDKPMTKQGDVWQCGDHLVYCGDATDGPHIRQVLGGVESMDMVFTDPPYNMNYQSKNLGGIKNDRMDEAKFVQFILRSAFTICSMLKSGGSYYICMSAAEYPLVYHQLRKLGLAGRQIIWVKPSPGLGAQEYRPQYEVMLYGYTGSRDERVWNGKRGQSDLWQIPAGDAVIARQEDDGMVIEVGSGIETTQIVLDKKCGGSVISFTGESCDLWRFGRENGVYVHPTQKPVALIERAIRNSSNAGDIVLDLFGGSGSTLIACERTNRKCRMAELDPAYCDVIVRRWAQYTGLVPEKVAEEGKRHKAKAGILNHEIHEAHEEDTRQEGAGTTPSPVGDSLLAWGELEKG